MGWIPYSSVYCQVRMGSYCYVPLCQVLKIDATRGPKWVVLIRSGEPSGMFDRRLGSLLIRLGFPIFRKVQITIDLGGFETHRSGFKSKEMNPAILAQRILWLSI
jgi:hypothetical protein